MPRRIRPGWLWFLLIYGASIVALASVVEAIKFAIRILTHV